LLFEILICRIFLGLLELINNIVESGAWPLEIKGGDWMKGLFSKVMVVIAGAVAFFGISTANVTASVSDISGKSALYLEHGKQINSDIINTSWHESHASHHSHHSHHSHSSGY
jgi:hypothetical protein